MQRSSEPYASKAFARVLSHGRWHVLAAGLVGAVLASLLGASRPLHYQAAGLLVLTEPVYAGKQASDRLTEIDVLHSHAVLASVVGRLNLGRSPDLVPRLRNPLALVQAVMTNAARLVGSGRRMDDSPDNLRTEKAVNILLAHLKISGSEDSRALTVAFDAGTPKVAADVVNEIMKQYIALEGATTDAATVKTSTELLQRAASVHLQADAVDQRIQEFQNMHDVLMLEAGSTVMLQLNTKQSELAAARQELVRAQAAVSSNRDLFGKDHVSATRELQDSPVMQSLNERETDVLQQLAQDRNIGSRNPRRLDRENALRSVQMQIAAETQRVSDSLVHDVQAAAQRVTNLQDAVDQAQAEAQRSNAAQLALSRLIHEADSDRTLYQTLVARAEDARMGAGQPAPAKIVSLAVPPDQAEPSRLLVMTALGLMGGMLLAGFAIMSRHLLYTTISSSGSLRSAVGLMSLGSLPLIGRHERVGLVELAVAQPHSPLAETLRGLRLAVQNISTADSCKVILVTSAERGEGKSSVAAGLGRRAAGDGLRVLLIEADMHRPSLARFLSVDTVTSLEEVLLGLDPNHRRLAADVPSGMHCLLSRGDHPNPFALLASERFGALVAFARQAYDLVVIDSPPALRVSDPVLLSRWADLILFAVRAEKTPLSQIIEALQRFPERTRAKIATVLTHARDPYGAYGGYHDARGDQVGTRPEMPAQVSPDTAIMLEREEVDTRAS